MPLYDPNVGFISTIQKKSVQDGPGIRDTVLFKGCPLGCLWCSSPELIRPVPDLLYTREKCIQCGKCIQVCPHKALSLDEDGFVSVDRALCAGCGDCVAACPQGALELVGKYVTVDEVVKELLKDHVFYQTSNGGVTFSGGEPLWQAGFTAQVAEKMKTEDIHTALDTTGDVSWCRFEEVLPFIDLVLYSVKAVDNDLHRQLTGRDNDLILMNAQLLAERKIPMHVRLELVPGVNDSCDSIQARMEFVSELQCVSQIDLLPYHLCKEDKYNRLGLDDPLLDLPEYEQEKLDELSELVESYGFKTTVGG